MKWVEKFILEQDLHLSKRNRQSRKPPIWEMHSSFVTDRIRRNKQKEINHHRGSARFFISMKR